ncbi:MAG: AbrB/MazE/SpoVT family DNA-binding domain-containing protein [Acidimicrobiales bacterium]
MTTKLQVTIPMAIARRYGIEPGPEIDRLPAGGAIGVVPGTGRRAPVDTGRRLRLFDAATNRQRQRDATRGAGSP